MGTNISKHNSSQSFLNVFKLLLNFLPSGPRKNTVLHF